MARKTKAVPKTAGAQSKGINAAPPPEIITVHAHRVACDGVGGALGHPRVWIELGEDGQAKCGYCDRRFVLNKIKQGHTGEQRAPGVYEGTGGH